MKNDNTVLPRRGTRDKKRAKARIDFEEANYVPNQKVEKEETRKPTKPNETKKADNSEKEIIDKEESEKVAKANQDEETKLMDEFESAMDDDSEGEGELIIIIYVIHMVKLF